MCEQIGAFRTLIVLSVISRIVNADIAEFGGCFQNTTNGHRCAMNSASCVSSIGEIWLKPFELNRRGVTKPCNCEDAHIANCVPGHGQRGDCAVEEDSCPGDQRYDDSLWFYNDGGTCMCHGMTAHPYSTNVFALEKTLYGACKEGSDIRCSVHSNQCEVGEQWMSSLELKTAGYPPCTCDKVRVGSCKPPFNLQCVVDNESCEDEDNFLSPYITRAQGNDCFLCSADVFEVVPDIRIDGSRADDDNKADDDDSKAADDDSNSSDVSQKTFVITLAFMISGMFTALLLSLYLLIASRRSADKGIDTKSASGSVV